MPALDTTLLRALETLEQNHKKRTLKMTRQIDAVRVMRGGRELVSFSSNNYLGLTHHPAVKRAATAAIKEYGAGAGASRLITGNHPLYRELENKLAAMKGTAGAVVFGSGFLANLGTLKALAGEADLILLDRLAHASLLDGARLSGATRFRFRHNDMEHLERLLAKHRRRHRRCLIVTETVFSMDGDTPPLARIMELAAAHDAWVMTDDAHGLGVVSAATETAQPDIQMGTLSKAVGSYGGYVCGSLPLMEYLITKARPLIYSTALPPPVIAAAIAALEVIATETALTQKPLQKARLFAGQLGLSAPQSPIVPVILGETEAALKASQFLEQKGFLVTAIRPPTVPEGTARLRFAFSALHEDRQVLELADIVREQGWAAPVHEQEMAEA